MVSWWHNNSVLYFFLYYNMYRYHHSLAMSNMYALREAIKIIAEEVVRVCVRVCVMHVSTHVQGLEAVWKRHRENAEMLWKGLNDLGLELFVRDPVSST